MELPEDVEEAALVDGCSRLEAFRRIVLPLATHGLVVTSIFCFTLNWNEFLFALLFTSVNAKTGPVGISVFHGGRVVAWGKLTAGATVFLVPVIVFTILARKYLARGLTLGVVRE